MKRALASQNKTCAATDTARGQLPWFLFAPGAGAPSTSAWMENWRESLSTVGPVVTFDYPYRHKRQRRPDPLPVLIEAHRQELASGRRERGSSAWLIGKSMGSRVGCHLASTEVCEGVVCFGYPLVSQSGIERIEALTACPVPLLLIQGTRDRLAPLESLRAAIRTRTAPTRLVVVPSGDHSLELTRSHLLRIGKTQADVNLEILSEIRGFLSASDLPLFTEVEVAQATRDR